MGQSLSLAAQPGGAAGIDVPELSDVTYEKSLGTARLMKCVRARHQDGLVVIKLVMKPLATFELATYVKTIRNERRLLADIPNALGYQRVFETSTNGYLVRQYFYSSLYDRLSTRPFLEDIEKRWLTYQLLCAVRDSHACEVYHGDIKTENILVSSWNWLYLTDYSASYKPTYLPEDNPADFSYFFDNSGRRTCYLAPERFLPATELDRGTGVTWAMDIFSVGCVIAELFTEAPIFNLSQLFKYRNGEYDPSYGYLNKIQDKDVREMVSHMIQVQPESRYSAEEYLNFWRRRAFPEYFYSFLHQYMASITDPAAGRSAIHPEDGNFGDADDRIDKVYFDFDKIAYFLGYDIESKHRDQNDRAAHPSSDQMFPIHINIPGYRHPASTVTQGTRDDGTLIFLTLIVSSLRHTARSSSRIRASDLMLAFAERVTDEAKMDRILPYLVTLLNDRVDNVKVAALRTLTQLLALVKTISPVNAHAFPEYIKPRLQQFTGGPGPKASALARSTYASCLASLARSSINMIDVVQALNADGSIPTIDADTEGEMASDLIYQHSFDTAKADLLDLFEAHTKALLTDKHPSVRRALLGSVSGLCIFFGNARANDVVLSHLNTYLNDKDWILKCAFLRTIVGVATFVGGPAVEEFILPLMIQSLNDRESFVIQEVLSSFAVMAELGLFQRSRIWELIDICARYMIHPCAWVREASVHFVAASTRFLSLADCQCLVAPLLQPYLKVPLSDFTETTILDVMKKPLSSSMFEVLLQWASNARKSRFWQPDGQKHTFSFVSSGLTIPAISSRDLKAGSFGAIEKSKEDEQWIRRLREKGLNDDDELKVLALREHIRNLSLQSTQSSREVKGRNVDHIIPLKDIQITPQTIFFESQTPAQIRRRASFAQDRQQSQTRRQHVNSSTITDALLDASTTGARTITRDSLNERRETSMAQAKPQPIHTAKMRETATTDNQPTNSIETQSEQQASEMASTPSKRPSKPPEERGSRSHEADDTDVPQEAAGTQEKYKLRQKPSVMQLLNRHDTFKTTADTSTDNTNATGRLEGAMPTQAAALRADRDRPEKLKDRTSHSPVAASHSYAGSDPTVLRLLDSLAHDNYPRDVVDFGPQVVPVSKRQSASIADIKDEESWTPRGILLANFGEHTGVINRVLPAPDHSFFVTGSDDGTVKIWDSRRLERNLTHRSRYTFTPSQGQAVKALSFIENTYTFVSAQKDGSIKAIKLEQSMNGEASKLGRPRIIRDYQLPDGEHAVWLEHAKVEALSLLLVATTQSRIIAIDLRTMDELYVLHNPVHHGTPTCFCVDHNQGWFVVGTSHGVLDLWDLRFRLRLKAWSFAGAKPVHRIAISPFSRKKNEICVAGGTGRTEITFWDLDKGECFEVFRALHAEKGSITDSVRPYEAWKVDDEKPEGMLGRFATAIDPRDEGPGGNDNGFRALTIWGGASSTAEPSTNAGIILTGGADRKLRYWALPSHTNSMVVSGLEPQEPQPRYLTSTPLPTMTFKTEFTERPSESTDGGTSSKRSNRQSAPSNNAESSNKRDAGGSEAEEQRKLSRTKPRNTLITEQQQTILQNHLDDITDICLLQSPVRLIVSVDRMGSIRVFQ